MYGSWFALVCNIEKVMLCGLDLLCAVSMWSLMYSGVPYSNGLFQICNCTDFSRCFMQFQSLFPAVLRFSPEFDVLYSSAVLPKGGDKATFPRYFFYQFHSPFPFFSLSRSAKTALPLCIYLPACHAFPSLHPPSPFPSNATTEKVEQYLLFFLFFFLLR